MKVSVNMIVKPGIHVRCAVISLVPGKFIVRKKMKIARINIVLIVKQNYPVWNKGV